MLLYPPIKDLLGQVPSRYMLVNLVASRARKLSSESEASGEPLEEKAVSLAIRRGQHSQNRRVRSCLRHRPALRLPDSGGAGGGGPARYAVRGALRPGQ